jgi:vacuolar-type H+-ATPase subunit E/Vma4
MAVGEEKQRDVSVKLREMRSEKVEEAVERAARRMDADEEELKILEEMAESLAERLTSPVVESADKKDSETVEKLFLD